MGQPADELAGAFLDELFAKPFELLLGRKTYDIFAAYWPLHPEITSVATPFNSTKKYVVTHTPRTLSWNNSQVVTGDVVAEIAKIKESDGPDLWVWGSGNLIQLLLTHHLIDEMHILTYPVTIGTGKKLFADGTQPQQFTPIKTQVGKTGVVISSYHPAGKLIQGTVEA
jgi:dihydrofolate reductase